MIFEVQFVRRGQDGRPEVIARSPGETAVSADVLIARLRALSGRGGWHAVQKAHAFWKGFVSLRSGGPRTRNERWSTARVDPPQPSLKAVCPRNSRNESHEQSSRVRIGARRRGLAGIWPKPRVVSLG
jgi:hypothetical protein